MSKIEALRQAQIWMLRNPADVKVAIAGLQRSGDDELGDIPIDSFAAPKFWAAWVLSGDWR